MPGAHKIGAAISGPRIAGGKKYGHEAFSDSPKGPKIEKIQDRLPGLMFSSETEHFKRATHQIPIFVGILKVRIESFKRD